MKVRFWYIGSLVFILAAGTVGILTWRSALACDDGGCQVDEDIDEYEGDCTRCTGAPPCGWNCHGATSHAHGGEGGAKAPADLKLKWGERYDPQPLDGEGNITSLNECDIVVYGIDVPEPAPPDTADVTGFKHSATGTGDGTNVWQAGRNEEDCIGCTALGCMNVIDANVILAREAYDNKCVVFPGSAFGE
jgi:hypothetical protein